MEDTLITYKQYLEIYSVFAETIFNMFKYFLVCFLF